MRWKLLAISSGTALFSLAAIGAALSLTRAGEGQSLPSSNHVPRSVKVVSVVAELDSETESYTGVVRARYEAELAFRVGGKVIARLVDVGDTVRAGQPLARLDPQDFDLALKAAEAQLAAAQATARNAASEDDRSSQLRPSGAISAADADRTRDVRTATQARVDEAQRNVDLATNRLGYCILTAAADGVVMARTLEVGQVVAEGQSVIQLARDGEREAVVSIPENRCTEARMSSARAFLWGSAGAGYSANLRELSPVADAITRTYPARFTIENAAPEVTLGRTVTVQLRSSNPATRLVVPLTALTEHDGKPAVWVVSGDQIAARTVSVVQYRNDEVIVSDGVQSGDVIVAAGVQKLDSNLRVYAWEDKR